MAVTFESIAASATGTSSALLPWPASLAANDLCIIHGINKPFGTKPTWNAANPLVDIASGSVAQGNGTGSVVSTSAIRVADGAIGGTETMSNAGSTPMCLGQISRWSIAAGKYWGLQTASGADTTVTGTTISIAVANLAVIPGDVLVMTVCMTDDADTFTPVSLAMTGVTFSGETWETAITTTSGNDGYLRVGRVTIATGTTTATLTITATAGTSGQSACACTVLKLREQDAKLPGLPMGSYGDPQVEPESHGHNPPIIDSNGNLYRAGESNLSHDTNRLLVHKSTDGGITWRSVDWVNHPTAAQDLECMWTVKVGTKIHYLITRDDTVWLAPFNMSDDGSPDTYGTQEVVESALSSSGVVQFCSIATLSNGDEWFLYSDLLNGANNQIGIEKRSTGGTYSLRATFNDGAVDVTGPVAITGASDVTYVFYKNKTSDLLVYRTVTSAGTISAATTVASGAAISSQSMAHTNAVYYDDAGTEVIGVAYINDSDILKYREIRGGSLQSEETISTAALTRNPGTTDSQSVVAHLAVDSNKVVYAMWSRASDGDLMLDKRVNGAWSGNDVQTWASGNQTGWYIYCDIVEDGPDRKLIYTYDAGVHIDDASNTTYNEIVITPPPITMARWRA